MAGKRNRNRPDQNGVHRGAFERNKKKIYARKQYAVSAESRWTLI